MSSGKVSITAHFHQTGDQTFVSDDSQTAYQKYQTYLNSHNVGESSGSSTGCYTSYHPGHTHSESCKLYRTCTVTRYWTGRYQNFYCHWEGGVDRVQGQHRVSHSSCGAGDTDEWICTTCGNGWGLDNINMTDTHQYWDGYSYKCGQSQGSAYYTPSCGHRNGQILSIEITL